MARVVAWVESLVAPAHVDRTAVLAAWAGGSRNPLDHWVVFAVIGVAAGGLVSGLVGGRVRAETYRGPRVTVRARWVMAFAGGILMGYGARLARGCTSGQALTGGAALSLGSWFIMFAFFAAGYLLAWPLRRFWR